jgi:predicted histidine transporter YuiF (NhaC family)
MIDVSQELRGYLMYVADSDLFGGLAIVSLLLVISAISQRLRQSLLHRGLTFMVLISLVTIEVAGTWYSSVRPV